VVSPNLQQSRCAAAPCLTVPSDLQTLINAYTVAPSRHANRLHGPPPGEPAAAAMAAVALHSLPGNTRAYAFMQERKGTSNLAV
jgi:hypothetical protein